MGTKKFEGLERKAYLQIRNSIQTGDIFFASGNYPVSRIIEHFSDSMFSHVGFVFTWNERVLLLESVEDDGVRMVPLSHYLSDYENSGEPYNGRLFLGRYNAAFDAANINRMLGKAADTLNKKYDKDEISKIIARITIGLGKHGDNDAYICSEFVDICFREIGIVFPRDSRGFIFPEHIAADANVQPLYEIVA
ncbi:YiiX/YebB-like N1pC/P60 family cysteine hydrolase [Nitrosomonas sp. wSCUT-2]